MLFVLGVVSLPAAATIVTINGSPYDVYIGDLGNIQAKADSSTDGVFYPSDQQAGDGGFFLGFPAAPLADEVAGPPGEAQSVTTIEYTPVSQGAVTGTGTSGSPFTQQTVYKVVNPNTSADVLRVTQTIRYVNGESKFKCTYAVQNLTGSAVRFRASAGADLYIEGSDSGTGFLFSGSPRFVAGANQNVGRAGGIEEVPGSVWSSYQLGGYSAIWDAIGYPAYAGFDNTLVDYLVDNGVGVQWDTHYGAVQGLAGAATATFEVVWRFGSFVPLVLSPVDATRTIGSTHHITATAKDATGALLTGKTIRYNISGANAHTGSAITNGLGQADIAWTGSDEGADEISVYIDLNDDGTRQAGEPQVEAFVDWITSRLPAVVPVPAPSTDPSAKIVSPKPGKIRSKRLASFSGTAGPAGKVSKVEIALRRLDGRQLKRGRCLWLRSARAKFVRTVAQNRACTEPRFLAAKGSMPWSFALRKRLPRGSYEFYVRVTLLTGEHQTVFTEAQGNLRRFKVL